MNRKLFHYVLLTALAGVVLWACQRERFSHSDEPYSQPDLTVSEAQQIFEQQYAESLPYMTKSTGDKPIGMTPGAFTPLWKKARLGATQEMSGADVPIDPEYIFVALFREITANGDTIRRSVDVTQKLVVKKWRDTTQGTASSYIVTIVPTPDCYAKHKDIGKVFQYGGDKGDFSGFVVYQTFDGIPVAIGRYQEGQVSRYEYFPLITKRNIDSVATVMDEVIGDNVSFQSGTPMMFAIGQEQDDEPLQWGIITEEVTAYGKDGSGSKPWFITISIWARQTGLPTSNPREFNYETVSGGGGGVTGTVGLTGLPNDITDDCSGNRMAVKAAAKDLYDITKIVSSNIYGSPTFSTFMDAIKASPNVEHGFLLKADMVSEHLYYGQLYSADGPMDFVNVPSDYTANAIAVLHSHPERQPSPPSALDVLDLGLRFVDGNESMQASYVFAGEDVYCLQVTDPDKAMAFAQNNIAMGSTFDLSCEAGKMWQEAGERMVNLQGIEQYCAMMAYVLDRCEAGIMLLRKDKNSESFKAYGTTRNNNNEYYPTHCQ